MQDYLNELIDQNPSYSQIIELLAQARYDLDKANKEIAVLVIANAEVAKINMNLIEGQDMENIKNNLPR